MANTIIIRGDIQKATACADIIALPLDPVHEVVIREHKVKRSVQQNRLYWKILGMVAEKTGETPQEQHYRQKRDILAPIYVRDDQGYAEMYDALMQVPDRAMMARLGRQVIKMTSTTTATVSQFTELIREVENEANGIGVYIAQDEMYSEAMAMEGKR